MKKIVALSLGFFIVAVLVPRSAVADVGIKGGLSFSKFSQTGVDPSEFKYFKSPIIGGFFYIKLGPLAAIQPEVFYARMGTRLEGATDYIEYRIDYIQIPILLKLSVLSGPISPVLFAGPYGSLRLGAKRASNAGGVEQTEDFKDQIESTDYGLIFGGGIDFQPGAVMLSLEARYNLGLPNVLGYAAPGTLVKNRSLMVLIGIGF